MTFFLNVLNLFLVIVGLSTVVRYLIWKATEVKDDNMHFVVLLKNKDAEIIIRSALERAKTDFYGNRRKIYAVNMGLDEQTERICRLLANDYSQLIFCEPEELGRLL